jgi:hypothetical protein
VTRTVDDSPCDEDTDAEPSLRSFDQTFDQVRGWSVRLEALISASLDAELDNCDGVPSLASVNTHHNQTRWTEGNSDDREGDGCADDREPDVDDEDGGDREPAFGWNDAEAVRGRYPSAMGIYVDREG